MLLGGSPLTPSTIRVSPRRALPNGHLRPFYTLVMRHLTAKALAVAVITAHVLIAQTQKPMTPTAPGTPGDPTWQGIVRLADGRTFVTDGGLAIDAALAKPATMPEREFPAKLLQDYLNAAHKDECSLSELKAVASGRTYTTPSGIALNATYVDYLRRRLPGGSGDYA
jgi:hypothetical protein